MAKKKSTPTTTTTEKVKFTKDPSQAKPVGRPTDYTPELGHEICQAIANTNYGIKRLCLQNPHWPDKSTIIEWLGKHKEFADHYALAKDIQLEDQVDEMIEIADNKEGDLIASEYGFVGNGANVQRSKLMLDARKWAAEHLKPKKYGKRLDLTTDGEKITNQAPIIKVYNGEAPPLASSESEV